MRHNLRIALLGASIAGLALATPVFAAEPTVKVLTENDTMQVLDVIEKPGDVGAMAKRTGTVIYVMSGGTFERTYADGTKETLPRKSGDAAIITEKRAYSVKNIGTTTIHLIEVVKK